MNKIKFTSKPLFVAALFICFSMTIQTQAAPQLAANGKIAFTSDRDGNSEIGDGKTDVAVFRPQERSWFLRQSNAGFLQVEFGTSTSAPAPADYDGDGKADLAVFTDGMWHLLRSRDGLTGILFGASNDIPVPGAFVF